MDRIEKDIDRGYYLSLRSQARDLDRRCSLFERLCTLLEKNEYLPYQARVPYLISIDSLLDAMMVAHGLLQESDLEDSDRPLSLDKKWILALSQNIHEHYERDVKKNHG